MIIRTAGILAALTIPLAAQDATIDGTASGERLGESLAIVADVDGDLVPELVIGAPGSSAAGTTSGAVRVMSGADQTLFFSRDGAGNYDEFGIAVAGTPDINGDGVPDILAGAREYWFDFDDNFAAAPGYAQLLSGADGTPLRVMQAAPVNPNNFTTRFGTALTSLDDLDNDGVPEIAVGARLTVAAGALSTSSGTGRVQIFSGATGIMIRDHWGKIGNSDLFGAAVADAGDITGDGVGDYLISATFRKAISPPLNTAGAVFLYDGATGAIVWTEFGPTANDNFGTRIVMAGDVDNDGARDVLISSRDRVQVHSSVDGRLIHAVLTEDHQLNEGPAAISLGDLNGDDHEDFAIGDSIAVSAGGLSTGIVTLYSGNTGAILGQLNGEQLDEHFGATLALLTPPDAPSQLVIGAPGYDGPAGIDAGRVTLYENPATVVAFPLIIGSPNEVEDTGFGRAVAIAGDVDNDGWDDVLAGAPLDSQADIETGRAFVFSGFDGSVLHEFAGDEALARLGTSVATAGDVDHDGFADVVISAPSTVAPGRVFLRSGKTGAVLRTYVGLSNSDRFGAAIDGGGDADGDGVPDVVVGAPGDDVAGVTFGAIRVFSGATGQLIHEVVGDESAADFGTAVAFVGDLDDDGRDDIAIGARHDDSGPGNRAGRVLAISSATGAVIFDVLGQNAFDNLGTDVDAAGDNDGDGVPDVLVGIPRHDGDFPDTGRAVVLSGVDGRELFEMTGSAASGWLASSVAGLGDVNGDGVWEYALSARTAGIPTSDFGHAEVRDGVTADVLFKLDGSGPFTDTVDVVSGRGDVDNDGVADFLIGTTNAEFLNVIGGGVVVINFNPSMSPWRSAGALLPGGANAPQLNATGTLLGNEPLDIHLSGALPFAPATLVFGIDELGAPFKGGILVPAPLGFFSGLTTNSDGDFTLASGFPDDVPAGITLVLQAWISDAAGPVGLAASNAVIGTTP